MSDDLDKLLALSEDDLLAEFGKALPRDGTLGISPSRPMLIARASRWWSENKETVARHICTNAELCRFYTKNNEDNRALAGLIVDILGAATVTESVPIGTLSVLCVKKGLAWVCGANWPEQAWTPAGDAAL
jgi:hypothetical protein